MKLVVVSGMTDHSDMLMRLRLALTYFPLFSYLDTDRTRSYHVAAAN